MNTLLNHQIEELIAELARLNNKYALTKKHGMLFNTNREVATEGVFNRYNELSRQLMVLTAQRDREQSFTHADDEPIEVFNETVDNFLGMIFKIAAAASVVFIFAIFAMFFTGCGSTNNTLHTQEYDNELRYEAQVACEGDFMDSYEVPADLGLDDLEFVDYVFDLAEEHCSAEEPTIPSTIQGV